MTKKLLTFAALLIFAVFSGTDCSAVGSKDSEEILFGFMTDDSGLRVYIKNYDESSEYELSINGGESFIPIYRSSGIYLRSLPKGTYQLRVMKDGDRSTLTDVKVCELYGSGAPENDIKILCEGIKEYEYQNGGLRITIENYSPSTEYMLSYDGGRIWRSVKGRVTEIYGLSSGYYNVCVRNKDDIRSSSGNIRVYIPTKSPRGSAAVEAPLVKQLPELPTGCEITTLAMALNFYGFSINHTTLADYYLEKAEYQTADFRKKFVGDPRQINSYGCYAGVIVNSAEKFLGTVDTRTFDVNNITGCKPESLYAYIDMGYPVMVWATAKMMPTGVGSRWMDRETGNIVEWKKNEHCLLLTGYDYKLGRVYMNDPQYGYLIYDMKLFEQRFKEMESQAIVIVETTENKS